MSNADKKQYIDMFNFMFEDFSTHTIYHSEKNAVEQRRALFKQIKKLKTYYHQSRFIDQKIEFDQRFYNDGYQEFQLMISDIRKQTRLNKEVFALKSQLKGICDQIEKEQSEKNQLLEQKKKIEVKY